MKRICFISLLFALIAFGREINVSAAANLSSSLEDIKKAFLLTHPSDKINISYGSSGKAYTQIMQGAPVDLFVSADEDFPHKLFINKLAPQKEQVYAQGVLVLWSNDPKIKVDSLEILLDKNIAHIALINPELAPYGRAAKEVLQKSNLYEKIQSKLINATSISQAHQFVQSLNAEVGFGALSLIDKNNKNLSYILVDKSLYSSINQALILTNDGEEKSLAKEFKAFILGDSAKKIFKKYGYIVNE